MRTRGWGNVPGTRNVSWDVLACLGAVAIAGPLLLIPNRLAALGAIVLAPMLGMTALRVVRPESTGRPVSATARLVDAAVLGLLAMAGIGALVGSNGGVSGPRLAGLLYAAGIYAAVRRYGAGLRGASTVTWLLTFAGLAIALLGFVGTEWLTEYSKSIGLVPLYDRLPRLIRDVPAAHGTIGGFHPNEVAGVLAVLAPVAMACAVAGVLAGSGGLGRLRAGIAVAALVAMAAYLLVSVSRSSWLSAGAGILAMLVACAPRAALRLSPVAIVAGAVVALVARQRVSQALLASDLTWSAEAWDRPTRFEIWQRALQLIRDHPWTGVGLNAFPYVVQARYPFARHSEFLVPHAHNLFLQTAVDYGLPGLVCLATLLAGGFAGAVRVLRLSGERAWRLTTSGVVGALTACATFGLLDAVAIGAKPTFLLFAVVAVGVCAGESVGWPEPGRSGDRLDGSATGWPDSSSARSD